MNRDVAPIVGLRQHPRVFSGTALLLPLLLGAPPEAVAVFPIKPTDVRGFRPRKMEKFGDLLDSVVSSHGIPTVPRSDLRELIRQEQAESFKNCYDEACQIELGKSVAAQKILGSTWSKFGDACVLAIRLYDLKTELTEFSTTQEVPCTETGLKQAINNAGLDIAGHYKKDDSSNLGNISAFSPAAQGRNIKNRKTDRKGYLFVTSEPSGAQVFINGEERGATPYQVELMAGRYVLIVTAGALYKPLRRQVKLTPKGVKLEAKLKPNFGILHVETTPPGAKIALNGEPTGYTTPHTFPPKKSGKYRVTVTHPHYFSAEKSTRLFGGRKRDMKLTLRPNYGALAVASEPSGVSIFIDGKNTGRQTPALVEPVADGTHTVEVKNERWTSDPQQVTVRRDQRASASFALKGRYGILKVAATLRDENGVRPVEAKVFVDGQPLEAKTPLTHQTLAGDHEVTLSIDGARPIVRQVRVLEDDTVRISEELSMLSPEQVKAMQLQETIKTANLARQQVLESRASGRQWALWTGVTGGVAVLAGGALLGVAGSSASRADDASTVADLDSAVSLGQTSQTAGWIAISAGGVALVSSLILYLVNKEPSGTLSTPRAGEPW